MIEDKTGEGYLQRVRDFAQRVGLADQLDRELGYLADYGAEVETRCELYSDFAPYSFFFVMHVRRTPEEEWRPWFNGGLIYHGAHDNGGDGSFPTLAVCLEPSNGWSVHT